MVKFQQRYQKRHGGLPKPLFTKGLCLRDIPQLSAPFKQPIFGSLIPTEFRRLSPEICCYESPRCWRLLAGSAAIVPESLLAIMGSGQKFIARLPRDWSRSLPHGLKKARTESVQGYALPARFLCRFWYLCWNLTNYAFEIQRLYRRSGRHQ
jgi:hypothetical protein